MGRSLRRGLMSAAWGLVLLSLTACGPAAYSLNAVRATRAVERARQADAGDAAPYELHKAEAHLDKAREEASEAAYQDAVRFAKAAEQYAQKAMEIARRRRQGAGR